MSATTRPVRPAPPAPPPGAAAGPATGAGATAAPLTGRGTPRLLRAWSVVLVVVGLVVGGVSVRTFLGADDALHRADANAAQLVRVQDVQTSLVAADAQVTNAFLAGGLESAERRTAYTDAIDSALRQMTAAARAQPADEKVLADLATQVQDYTGTIELARANNRQALPVGAQYLKNASAGLRADALPALGALTDANDARVLAELDTARTSWPVSLAGWLGVLALAAASVWVARRTHRYLNVPIVVATVLLLGFLVAAGSATATLSRRVVDVRDGAYAQASALAASRIAAFDAKSNESLTLVARGSGAAFEDAWKASLATAQDKLAAAQAGRGDPTGIGPALQAYADRHANLRSLDDGGDWDAAVALATTDVADGTPVAFAHFDEVSAAALDSASGQVSGLLAEARGPLVAFAAAGGVVGLLAAVLAWRGLARRIEEYR